MNVRPATVADLPAILAIYNEAVLNSTATAAYEPQLLEERAAWYSERLAKNYPVFVAEDTGRIVGWSALNPYQPRIGYRYTAENSVYVAADRRGEGIGRHLLEPLIEAAQERGFHAIIAGITADNEASVRLHAAFGFQQVGYLREVIFKFDRWLDLIYMELLLTPGTKAPERIAPD